MSLQIGSNYAPGVIVRQEDDEKIIEEGIRGVGVYVGAAPKGDDTGKAIYCPSKESFIKKFGEITAGSQLGNAVYDFFDHAKGAGRAFIVRVTNGTEVKASLDLYDRRSPKQNVLSLTAKNGGRWAGKRAKYFSAHTSGELAATVLTPTVSPGWLVNQWKDATLTLSNVTTKTYTVVSNTASTVSVTADSDMATDNGASSGVFSLELPNGGNYVAAKIVPSGVDNVSAEFGLEVYENGNFVYGNPSLSHNSQSKNYIENIVNNDEANQYVIADSKLTTESSTVTTKPVNRYLPSTAVSGLTAALDIVEEQSNTGLTAGEYKFEVIRIGSKCVPHTINIAFTGATAYTVTYGAPFEGIAAIAGETTSDLVDPAAANRTSAPTPYKEYTIDFSIVDLTSGGTAFTTADTLVIKVTPLPVDELINHNFYPDIDNDRRNNYLVTDNTPEVVTVKGVADSDLTVDYTTLPLGPTVTTGDLTAVDIDTLIFEYTPNNGATQSHTVVGATVGAAAIKTELETNLTGLTFTVATNTLVLTSTGTGAYSKMALDGTGFEAGGLNIDGLYYGTNGDKAGCSWPEQMSGGYDPGLDSYVEADYTKHYDIHTSGLLKLREKNLGQLQFTTPGNTILNVDQKGVQFCEVFSYTYLPHTPVGKVTSQSQEEWVTDTLGRSNMEYVMAESFGKVPNPLGNGVVTRTIVGKIMGLRTYFANKYKGYHQPAAGDEAILNDLIELPSETAGNEIDLDLLTVNGINAVIRKKSRYVIWGARMASVDSTWKFAHERETINHYTQVLRENFSDRVFKSNTPKLRRQIEATLRKFFIGEYQNGVLYSRPGKGIDDAFQIVIDDSVNRPETLEAGKLLCKIAVRITPIAEQLIFSISKGGVVEISPSGQV